MRINENKKERSIGCWSFKRKGQWLKPMNKERFGEGVGGGGKKVGIRTGEIQTSTLKSGDFALVQWGAHWRFLDQESRYLYFNLCLKFLEKFL